MDDRESQIANLRRIFSEARFSPKFHANPKFNGDNPCIDYDPFIDYDDVMANHYIIREDDNDTCRNSYANKMNEVIASYDSIEALVDEGWRLD